MSSSYGKGQAAEAKDFYMAPETMARSAQKTPGI